MNSEIQTLLTNLEAKHGIEILYACESGSRAWGFASPDSDYDIRFIYRRPIKDCYLVASGSDTIEVPIENDLDPGGWELRKALGLLAKSNGALIEWLHSPIVYRAHESFLEEAQVLAQENFSRKGLANHYRGMAHKVIKTDLQEESPTGKAYLYALRATLAAQHVLEVGTPPPVAFSDLLYLLIPEDREAVEFLLEWKKTAGEKDSPERMSTIDRCLKEVMALVSSVCDKLPNDSPSLEPFNEMLHRWTLWPDEKN